MEKKVTIFVDEKGFLRMLRTVFSREEFNPEDFLPRRAQWGDMFRTIGGLLGGNRVKVLWYTIDHLDYFPEGNWQDLTYEGALEKLQRIPSARKALKQAKTKSDKQVVLSEHRKLFLKNREEMELRFEKKQILLEKMALKDSSIHIKKSGWQACSLVDKSLSCETALETGMIVDMITDSKSFDIAVLLTGNGDFAPAVQSLTMMGKECACLNFPVKAPRSPARISRKLSENMDYIIDVPIEDFARFMGIRLSGKKAEKKAA